MNWKPRSEIAVNSWDEQRNFLRDDILSFRNSGWDVITLHLIDPKNVNLDPSKGPLFHFTMLPVMFLNEEPELADKVADLHYGRRAAGCSECP